ncbi:MAG: hypothetical protein OXC06_10555 [Acidimicrobiaceae bacterium]|nr:hypothetical protein [Acidimicrobiaceae bacterium]
MALYKTVIPSTVGTFLRSFTFGHVRQLDKAAEQALASRAEFRPHPLELAV